MITPTASTVQCWVADSTGKTEGRTFVMPTLELDSAMVPPGSLELLVHEHDPEHGNYGTDCLVSIRMTLQQAHALGELLTGLSE